MTSTTPSLQATVSIGSTPLVKIWIDLDNTPHVPFFVPIVRELEKRGHSVVVTARDAFQVCAFADQKGLRYVKVGRHYGKNSFLKVFGLVWRSLQLFRFFLRERPDIAVSHGSRSQLLLSNLLRRPTVFIQDWEFSNASPLTKPRWEIVPNSYPFERVLAKPHRVRRYAGIKEDVYAPEFEADPAIVDELGLNGDRLIITVRPPADEAHYHNPESELLLNELMDRVCQTPNVLAVLLPRNDTQARKLKLEHPEWFSDGKTIIPTQVVDGLNLLWHSDLVVSGGGTMNREAAALEVPVYSIFRGKTGAIDQELEKKGRLIMVRSTDEVRTKILFRRRDRRIRLDGQPKPALQTIVGHIEEIVRTECSNRLRD